MKKVVFLISSIALVSFSTSCKEKPDTSEIVLSEINNDQPQLAIAASKEGENNLTYVYVTARTGLSLREFNNLNSEKLAIMPYGTKLRILAKELQPTMTVGGIKGSMDEVEFNHKKGFAFSGYLSKFFPPEQGISAKRYAEELQKSFPETSYSESIGGTSIRPINSEILLLPTDQWHTAFYIAQQLYDFPKEFMFPSPNGKDEEIIQDNRPKKNVWVSELQVYRLYNDFVKITYAYTSKKFGSTINITREGDLMKIEKIETVE